MYVNIALGLIMLVAGRKMFWLFVGVVGFFAGFLFASRYFSGESQTVILIISLIAGVLGALLAVFLKNFAVALAGFIAGGLIAVSLISFSGWESGVAAWIIFIVGGIIGVILISFLFDWSLMLLSALMGAQLIVRTVNLESPLAVVVFLILFIIGVIIQSKTRRS